MSGANEPWAGDCEGAKRHRWGKERSVGKFSFSVRAEQDCQRCRRVRVIVYTKRGNHVDGYFTRIAEK